MSTIEEAKSKVKSILSEEEDYIDNIPENMLSSDRYYNAENNCDKLRDAVDALEDCLTGLSNAQE